MKCFRLVDLLHRLYYMVYNYVISGNKHEWMEHGIVIAVISTCFLYQYCSSRRVEYYTTSDARRRSFVGNNGKQIAFSHFTGQHQPVTSDTNGACRRRTIEPVVSAEFIEHYPGSGVLIKRNLRPSSERRMRRNSGHLKIYETTYTVLKRNTSLNALKFTFM